MQRLRTYSNREQAGRELASELDHLRDQDPVILALPRGGLPVARPIAEAFDPPLEVVLVRKLGVPGQAELAMGAVAEDGQRVLNQDVIASLNLDNDALQRATDREREELQRRARTYRGDRDPTPVEGRAAVLVDDGLATGASMRAAAQVVAQRHPRSVTIAVPVGSPDVVQSMQDVADEVICPMQPTGFGGVGRWYDDFAQVSDDDVRAILDAVAAARNTPR